MKTHIQGQAELGESKQPLFGEKKTIESGEPVRSCFVCADLCFSVAPSASESDPVQKSENKERRRKGA